MQFWHLRSVKCRPVCVPEGKQRHSSGRQSLSHSLTPSHPYVLAVPGVLWTTEQIAGRFIGETARQLGTHHKAKQMFRWLGEEVNGNERNSREWKQREGGDVEERDAGRWWRQKKNELIRWCKNSEALLAIPCQCVRWAKYVPLSVGHRSHGLRFRLPYWITHQSACCSFQCLWSLDYLLPKCGRDG